MKKELLSGLRQELEASPAVDLLTAVSELCRSFSARLTLLEERVGATQGALPMARVGFASAEERRAVCRAMSALLADCEADTPPWGTLTAEFLAFDRQLLETQALLDRCESLEDALCAQGILTPEIRRFQRRVAKERAALLRAAAICHRLRDRLTSFSFSIFPTFCTRIDQHADFDGDGACCEPRAVLQACTELRTAAKELTDIVRKEMRL